MAVHAVDPNQHKTPVLKAADWIAQRRAYTWYLINVGDRLDPLIMKLSGGRLRSTGPAKSVLVKQRGAKSGVERTTTLGYFTEGDKVILIASKGGAPKSPAWYHNLRAHPDVEATSDGNFEPYRAREATGEERERLWDLAVTYYSGFADYQRRANESSGRQIPVMVLEPR